MLLEIVRCCADRSGRRLYYLSYKVDGCCAPRFYEFGKQFPEKLCDLFDTLNALVKPNFLGFRNEKMAQAQHE